MVVSSVRSRDGESARQTRLRSSCGQKPANHISGAYLARVVRLSSETGARFVRERISLDPVRWLMAPKLLFAGFSPVEACRTSKAYSTAMLLHELSFGLDCAPSTLAGLSRIHAGNAASAECWPPSDGGERYRRGEATALYTFAISADVQPGHIHIFGGMIASGTEEVRHRLRQRFGPWLEDEAVVRLGFDWSEPMACAMVSEAMADVLSLASEDPTSSIAAGLDFHVEQRFAA